MEDMVETVREDMVEREGGMAAEGDLAREGTVSSLKGA